MADETTPDAVEQAIAHLVNVLVSECSHTSETASALDVCIGNLRHAHHAERARHAEEVAEFEGRISRLADCARNVADDRDSLREQLRKVEGERDVSRRQCGELHEHLALIVRYFEEETSAGDGIAEQHYAGYQLAKIVLARTAPNEAAWETAMVEFAQLQERASHVPGLSAALDEARHELDARRALDADVRACAEYCRNILIGPPGIPALAARHILAALDSQGEEGE